MNYSIWHTHTHTLPWQTHDYNEQCGQDKKSPLKHVHKVNQWYQLQEATLNKSSWFFLLFMKSIHKTFKFCLRVSLPPLLTHSSLCRQPTLPVTWRHWAASFSFQSLELCDLSGYRCWGGFCSLGWCTDNPVLTGRSHSQAGLQATSLPQPTGK